MAEEKKKNNNKENAKKKDNKKNSEVKKKDVEKKASEVVKEESVKEEVVIEDKTEKEEKTTKDSFIKKHLTDILLVVGVLVVVIIGMVGLGTGEKVESKLIEVNYNEYADLIASNETFVFIVESANCGHCKTYMPVVEKFTKQNDVTIYYIDMANVTSEDDYNELMKSNSFFIENAGNWGTPTTMIVTGSTVSDSLVGSRTEEELRDFLVKNGIME